MCVRLCVGKQAGWGASGYVCVLGFLSESTMRVFNVSLRFFVSLYIYIYIYIYICVCVCMCVCVCVFSPEAQAEVKRWWRLLKPLAISRLEEQNKVRDQQLAQPLFY